MSLSFWTLVIACIKMICIFFTSVMKISVGRFGFFDLGLHIKPKVKPKLLVFYKTKTITSVLVLVRVFWGVFLVFGFLVWFSTLLLSPSYILGSIKIDNELTLFWVYYTFYALSILENIKINNELTLFWVYYTFYALSILEKN